MGSVQIRRCGILLYITPVLPLVAPPPAQISPEFEQVLQGRRPEVKKYLWGGEFWSDGYYISTVGKHKSEGAIADYVKNQGKEKEYSIIHKDQLKLDL